MLGKHDGITPLDDPSQAAQPMLLALGRLQAGKDVPTRRKAIERALSQIDSDDRYWMETLASRLSSDTGIEAIPAHLAALSAAWELREDEVATLIRSTNAAGSDDFSARAIKGIIAAAPAFGKRLKSLKISSDEVLLRVALAHAFRRDPSSTFQMFVIDGIARSISKGMKLSVQQFVKSCIERFDDSPVPEGAWGYIAVLMSMSGRSGYFVFPPTDSDRQAYAQMRSSIIEQLGQDLSDEQIHHHMSASAYLGFYRKGHVEAFVSLMSAIMEATDTPYLVLYAREEDGGAHTQMIEVPAQSPDEARRLLVKMPQVTLHDDLTEMTEFFAQQQDDSLETKN